MKMDETPRPDPASEQDERILTELFSRHKEFLFAPEPPTLDEVELAQCVEKLMEITREVRPAADPEKTDKPGKWTWMPFNVSPPLLALAASLVLVFGGLVWIGVQKAAPVASKMEPEPAPAGQEMVVAALMRHANVLGLIVPRDRSADSIPLFMRHYPPVAYLFTSDTNFILLRVDGDTPTTQQVATTAFALFDGDVILAPPDAQGVVVHPGRVTPLTEAGRYRLVADGQVFSFSEEKPLPGVLLPGILSPEALLAEDNAVVNPMQDADWIVLSPAGNTLSPTPPLVWMSLGDDRDEGACEVSLESVDGSGADPMGPVAAIGGRLDWSQTGWKPLPRGSSWRVVLRRDGQTVSDSGNVFQVLSDEEARGLDARLKDGRDLLGNIRPASLFAQASALLLNQPACAAEARLIAQQLRADAKANVLYLCLMRRAYVEMGLPKQALEVGGHIRNLLNAHQSAE